MEADPLLTSIAVDRAALAIAPIILGLNENDAAALAAEGSSYLTDAELEKLYSIVHAVRRELSNPV